MRENLMSGSMWQGMETRAFRPRRHPLTLPPDKCGHWPTTEELVDWWGVIKSTEPDVQYDDYFERQDLGQIIYFGFDSMDPAVKSQIEALRDSGRKFHLYGTLFSNVPDFNASQVQVDRIEVEG